jgi:hypothetical protein
LARARSARTTSVHWVRALRTRRASSSDERNPRSVGGNAAMQPRARRKPARTGRSEERWRPDGHEHPMQRMGRERSAVEEAVLAHTRSKASLPRP